MFDNQNIENLNFSCVVNKPRQWLDPALNWCQQELTSEWRWQLIQPADDHSPGIYKFYFSSEHDLVAFIIAK